MIRFFLFLFCLHLAEIYSQTIQFCPNPIIVSGKDTFPCTAILRYEYTYGLFKKNMYFDIYTFTHYPDSKSVYFEPSYYQNSKLALWTFLRQKNKRNRGSFLLLGKYSIRYSPEFITDMPFETSSAQDVISIEGQHNRTKLLYLLAAIPKPYKYRTHQEEIEMRHVKTFMPSKDANYVYYKYDVFEHNGNRLHKNSIVFCPDIGIVYTYIYNRLGIKMGKVQLTHIDGKNIELFMKMKRSISPI